MTKSVISEKKYHKASCTIKLPFFNVIVWLMCKILSRSYYRVLHKHRTSNQSPWLPKTLVMWSPCANWWAPHQQISILLWLASTAAKEVSLHKSMSRRHHDIVLRKYQLMLIHLAIVDNMFVLRLYQSPRIKRGCKLVLDRTIPRLKSEWADMHHSFHNQWVYFELLEREKYSSA